MLRAIDHFDIKEALQDQKDQQRKKWFIAARDQREKKAQLEERADEDFMDYASSVILATEIEVQHFQAKLDVYDEATVKALMENTQALEAVNERIQEKLGHAHTLEDGRKVFKSEDGTWAIDEDGKELEATTNDMDIIPKTKVTAEEYKTDIEERNQLNTERQNILDYQEKLDDARERSHSDDFTREELDALDKELQTGMPMAVKRQLPNYDPSQETSLQSNFTATVNPAVKTIIDASIQRPMMPKNNAV